MLCQDSFDMTNNNNIEALAVTVNATQQLNTVGVVVELKQIHSIVDVKRR